MTKIFGHRGARGERPENTIEGFSHARSLVGSGVVAGVECDIALTRDLVPVLHHDPDLPSGRLIRDLRFQELRQLSPYVPALQEALDAAPGMEWLVEIKTFPDAPAKTHSPDIMVGAVLAVLKNAGMMRQASILAFDWRVLSEAARTAPGLRRVCLTAPETEQSRTLWWGEAISAPATPDAVAQANAHGWAPFHATLAEAQIARARMLGLEIFPWTVNDAAEFRRLEPLVNGIITDYPSRISA